MFSLFEEQIRHDSAALEHFMTARHRQLRRSAVVLSRVRDYDVGPAQYLELIRKASEAVDIPIIASLNGVERARLGRLSREQMQEAGASGIELNVLLHPHRDVSHRARKSSSSISTCWRR